jgi:2-dehydro-3-deoxyphosphogalactonate aldolase
MADRDQAERHFAELPLVAILRGITPDEVLSIGRALVETGFRLIEVPLNSPDPIESIRRLAAALGNAATVGGGTVLSVADVAQVAAAGGSLVVSPNTDPTVIAATRAAGMLSGPGVCTPTEAFAAIEAGADFLKLFPAEQLGPAVLKAWRAVLPQGIPLVPVGGITPESMALWRAAGATGFGLGSALYKPGMTPPEVSRFAEAFAAAWRADSVTV